MRSPLDIDEFIHFASQPGATAAYVKESMGLPYSLSYVNRLIKRYVGKRPARSRTELPNRMREAVVLYMESRDLNRRYCSVGQHQARTCAIRALGPTVDDFVFVCHERCAAAGDF